MFWLFIFFILIFLLLLKIYFFTDLTHGNGGSLQVVSGTHRKLELDGIPHTRFNIDDYAKVYFVTPSFTFIYYYYFNLHIF